MDTRLNNTSHGCEASRDDPVSQQTGWWSTRIAELSGLDDDHIDELARSLRRAWDELRLAETRRKRGTPRELDQPPR